jgi:hypothetical protein
MIAVDIHGLEKGEDKKYGTLILEDGAIRCDPADSKLLNSIMEDRIVGKEWKKISAEDNPDEWMEMLHTHYKSAYMRATKAQEVE